MKCRKMQMEHGMARYSSLESVTETVESFSRYRVAFAHHKVSV